MSDFLSQEEIDALLRKGLQDHEDDPDEQAPVHKATRGKSEKASQASFSSFDNASTKKTTERKKRSSMQPSAKVGDGISIHKAVFQPFDYDELPTETTNLEIILNLNLEIRVELGKTKSTVRDVLEMGAGSVLELDKLNGEPVDLLVNQKGFAKGEMIVIGENFGVRVTDILSVQEIIEALR